MSLEEAVSSLQFRFALIDFNTHVDDDGNYYMKLTLVVRESMKIKMYKEDRHKRAHIHIEYGPYRHDASYAIDNGARLAGNLNRNYEEDVVEFIYQNRPALMEAWQLMQASQNAEHVIADLRG